MNVVFKILLLKTFGNIRKILSSNKRITRNQSAPVKRGALSHEIWIMPHTNVILILPFPREH